MAGKAINFDSVVIPNGAGKQAQQNEQVKEPTLFWLNVGVKRQDKLVQLPMGIPLDKLTARKVPSASTKNPEFRNLRLAEHQLWEKVKELMGTLKPGESMELPFTVEIRRVEEAQQTEENVEADANPFDVSDVF